MNVNTSHANMAERALKALTGISVAVRLDTQGYIVKQVWGHYVYIMQFDQLWVHYAYNKGHCWNR